MFTHSFMNESKAMMYSENRVHHYHTENNSLSLNIYTNYAVLCLVHDNCTPLYAISLEVKGTKANEILHKLIKSGEFYNIGVALSEKIISLAKESTQFDTSKIIIGLKSNVK